MFGRRSRVLVFCLAVDDGGVVVCFVAVEADGCGVDVFAVIRRACGTSFVLLLFWATFPVFEFVEATLVFWVGAAAVVFD